MIAGLIGHIPYQVAMEVMLTAGPVTVQRAHEVGFVNKIVPQGEQSAAAREYAEIIAANAPLVISTMRDLAWEARPKSTTDQYASTQQRLAAIMASSDAREGIQAQMDKRAPSFPGR